MACVNRMMGSFWQRFGSGAKLTLIHLVKVLSFLVFSVNVDKKFASSFWCDNDFSSAIIIRGPRGRESRAEAWRGTA